MIPRPNPRLSRKTKAVGSLGGTPTRPYGFLRGDLCGFFCPWLAPAGGWAFGRGPVRATPATPVCGHLRREGVARRRQKPCVVARGELSSPPLSLAIQRKGARGQRGRAAPEEWRWASLCFVLRPQQEPLARDCIARLRHSINNRDAARRVATNAEDPVPGHSPVGGHSLRSAPPLPRTR